MLLLLNLADNCLYVEGCTLFSVHLVGLSACGRF